jgi:hypothetical protein
MNSSIHTCLVGMYCFFNFEECMFSNLHALAAQLQYRRRGNIKSNIIWSIQRVCDIQLLMRLDNRGYWH